jgi:hypothetical protein
VTWHRLDIDADKDISELGMHVRSDGKKRFTRARTRRCRILGLCFLLLVDYFVHVRTLAVIAQPLRTDRDPQPQRSSCTSSHACQPFLSLGRVSHTLAVVLVRLKQGVLPFFPLSCRLFLFLRGRRQRCNAGAIAVRVRTFPRTRSCAIPARASEY